MFEGLVAYSKVKRIIRGYVTHYQVYYKTYYVRGQDYIKNGVWCCSFVVVGRVVLYHSMATAAAGAAVDVSAVCAMTLLAA